MISEAMAKWLDDQASITIPVYYGNIPQSVSTRPVIVVQPPHSYDHGQTANKTHPQKLEHFCIRIVGSNFTSLAAPRDAVIALLEDIAETHTPTTIGAYRCQGIIMGDITMDSAVYSKEVNDRRQPGSPEQDFSYCDIPCMASYHKAVA
ncbi:hypothetical protein UFOVP448_14 [uncultured Caudovirales phage]|uniref:Uncharacterized protein n=1 Tax=uncultured Caudovirales phage TaxID=2100421 RepID=A0A6J5MBW8_9CAUD|nr:hypothetical protein UFOVP448_14 [uncultured Caudovirales phage]